MEKTALDIDKKIYTINVYSENIAGLLNKITNIFTRRQLNIETLSVSASSIKGIHKYTITTFTDEFTVGKVTRQIEKIIDVLQAHYYLDDEIIYQEIALYKVPTDELLNGPGIEQLVRKHNARIMEVNRTFTVIELTGHPEDTEALYAELSEIGLYQFVRSGRIAITKSPVERLSNFLANIKKIADKRND